MSKVTARQFYQAWFDTVTNRKTDMLKVWRNNKQLTAFVKGSTNSVMEEVGNKLNLTCYHADYYSLDSILYKPEDKTPGITPTLIGFVTCVLRLNMRTILRVDFIKKFLIYS
jgi:hypothetical protein